MELLLKGEGRIEIKIEVKKGRPLLELAHFDVPEASLGHAGADRIILARGDGFRIGPGADHLAVARDFDGARGRIVGDAEIDPLAVHRAQRKLRFQAGMGAFEGGRRLASHRGCSYKSDPIFVNMELPAFG